jgi:nucleoside-diphosphate-sugar epimerase
VRPASTCLLTGATGFIGGHLARALRADGHRVRCLTRSGSDTSVLEKLDVELLSGELSSRDSLLDATRGCEHVVHCGALVSDWASVSEIARVNVQGTRNLLDAAVESSVRRFIHISTTDVYGHPGGPPVQEDYVARRLHNWYSRTKREAEQAVRAAAGRQGLEVVIIRPATVYGPRSVAMIGEIAQALGNGSMLLIGGGGTVAGLCYVENLADLVLDALRNEAAVGEAFNATDALEVTWKELTDDLAHGIGARPARWSMPYSLAYNLGLFLEQGYRLARGATGLSTRPLLSRQAVEVMGRDQRFSNQKAKQMLGFQPRVGYEEGLAATLRWLRGEQDRPSR